MSSTSSLPASSTAKLPAPHKSIIKTYIMTCFYKFCAAVFLLLLSTATLSLHAKTVTGRVLSDTDSTALAGVPCRLNEATRLVTGGITDKDGLFRLETNATTNLTLDITCTGYNHTEIHIPSGAKDISLGDIYLSEGLSLGEVTVKGQSTTDSRGRIIIYPEASDVKASATSISLFQKLPLAGLDANPINRTLTVDGGTPVILINGVPSTMDDVNALMPKDISKIEFSRVTPPRYADKGNSGLISITLKKRNDGGQVYLWTRSAVTTAFVDANLRASYHQGPSQFTLSYNPSWRNYQEVYDHTYESYIGSDFRVNLVEDDRNPFNYHTHKMQAKYDYSPDTSTLLSVTFRATPPYNKSRYIGTTYDSYLGEYDVNRHTSSSDFSPSLDLFFRKDFNEKNSIEAQVVGTLSNTDYRRDNQYTYTDGSTNDYLMDVDSRRHSLISEISYNHDFSDKTSLSGGFQNTLSRSTNTYLTSDYKPVLTENNNYIYTRLGQQIGKVYLSLSTGLKMFWINNDLNRRHFIRNRTQAQLSWNAGSRWSIQAAFVYGPVIPSLSQLTDYPQQVSPYLVSNGNPELKVTDSFVYQLMPSYRFKKFSTSLLLSYRHASNAVIGDMAYLGDNLFLSQSVNARRSRVFESNLNMKLNDIYGFGANVNLGVSHYYCTGADWSNKLTSFDASFSIWWNKGPYTISYWRKIPGKYLSGHYVMKDENGDVLSFEFNPDKHWTLGVGWMYMFTPKGTQYPTWSYSEVNPAYRERYIKNNGNMVVLSVSYNADFGAIFRSAKRNLNNSDTGSSLLRL